jgi:hypothetical protein
VARRARQLKVGLEDHAEGRLRGVAEIAEPAGGDDLAKARLASLPKQSFGLYIGAAFLSI